MIIKVTVDDYTVNEMAKDATKLSGKKISAKKAAKVFAEDIINRYFSFEYLDMDKLLDSF